MTDTTITIGLAALVGIASGADAAIWGMYKDATHEGFGWPRFLRSIVIGSAAAVGIQCVLDLELPKPGAMLVLFGIAYAAERTLVEVWKTFIREEDQSKYAIPMQFAIGGLPVKSRALRCAVGVAYIAVLASAAATVARLDTVGGTLVQAGCAGCLAGVVVALGGAWKDAPVEGFDRLKFFRSPALATAFALLLFPLTGSVLQAAVGAIGYERAASENYKTFFHASRARGKFAGKPVTHPAMRQLRRRFVPAYVAIRVALAWLVAEEYLRRSACAQPAGHCNLSPSRPPVEHRP